MADPRLPEIALLTCAEVADTLRVSKMTVYREIERRKLRAYRVGRTYRIDPRDLVEYMRYNDTYEQDGL